MCLFNQLHRLQSSGWTAHQRVTGHNSTGHEPMSSGSGGGATVWLKWIAHFAVGILLPHHYESNLAHLSDLCSLVIGLYKSERRAKKELKNKGLVVNLQNLHTFE